jgi:RNA polymerase sigma-70 factor (ECF subfamily)
MSGTAERFGERLWAADGVGCPGLEEADWDWQLVVRARSGEGGDGGDLAFRKLVERHQSAVYRLAYRVLGDGEEAVDASQDVFVRAYRRLGQFRGDGSFAGWLSAITISVCRDRVRARRSRGREWAQGGASPAEVRCRRPGPDHQVAMADDVAKLARGLQALPQRSREVLVLVCIEGHDHASCASVLGCSPRAVEGRLYRARRALLAWWNLER